MALLNLHHKSKAHIITLAIVIVILGAGVYRLIRNEMPMMRSDMTTFGAAGKSIILIGYQIFAEKTGRLYSVKANVIINSIEFIFWAAVVGMGVQGNMMMCTGDSLTAHCYIGWGINAASLIVCILSIYALVLSIKECRGRRKDSIGVSHQKLASDIDLSDMRPLHDVPAIPSYHSRY